MNIYKIAIILNLIVFTGSKGISQQSIYSDKNFKYLDSIEQEVKENICRGLLSYGGDYNKTDLKNDISLIKAINFFYTEDFRKDQIAAVVKEISKARVHREERLNGLINIVTLIINVDHFHVEITFDCIDNYIIRKKVVFSTSSYATCSQAGIRFLDFKLARAVLAGNAEFAFNVIDYSSVVANDFLDENLAQLRGIYTEYNFALKDNADSANNWINRILQNQYNSDSLGYYSYKNANRDFVALIKLNRTDVIRQLLDSPNYGYAVNAMESLLYLAATNKLVIDASLQMKIEHIQNSNFKISVQRSYDSFMIVDRYVELKMTKEKIVNKYQNSIHPRFGFIEAYEN